VANGQRVAAYGLIVENEKLLLCRISAKDPADAGSWTLPGGGIEFGEHPRDAAIREIFEETGLRARIVAVAGIDSIVLATPDGPLQSLRIIYRAEAETEDLVCEVGGSTDLCQWHPLGEIPALPLVDLVRFGLGLI
jgi:ADP-ribose pyrophosphatase YjhB (NUDIX family)